MKIIFLGQQGIPAKTGDQTEKRIEGLAKALAEQGHNITVTCSKTYNPARLRRLGGINLVYHGRFTRLLTLILIWRRQPDVVHIHGWKMSALVRLAALVSPATTYIWTVSNLPALSPRTKFIAWDATRVFDAITVPSRQLQYQLLLAYNLRATYIPDGYTPPRLKDIPAKHWGLRAGQYCVATTADIDDLRWIAIAYGRLATRKKLVTTLPDSAALRRLQKRYDFLYPVSIHGERDNFSLLRQAATVVFSDSTSAEELLQTMDAKRAIIAFSHEEIMGTTGQIVKEGDVKGLAEALSAGLSSKEQLPQGAKARQRARRHFQWTRILEEYTALYHYPFIRRVPLDSLLPRSTSQTRAIAH